MWKTSDWTARCPGCKKCFGKNDLLCPNDGHKLVVAVHSDKENREFSEIRTYFPCLMITYPSNIMFFQCENNCCFYSEAMPCSDCLTIIQGNFIQATIPNLLCIFNILAFAFNTIFNLSVLGAFCFYARWVMVSGLEEIGTHTTVILIVIYSVCFILFSAYSYINYIKLRPFKRRFGFGDANRGVNVADLISRVT